MSWSATCLVCRQPQAGLVCGLCGADRAQVENTLRTAEPIVVPSLWQLLWRPDRLTSPASEAIWASLSPAFQESVLAEYARLSASQQWLTSRVMVPLMLVLLASYFATGAGVAHALGAPGGKVGEWLCGAGGMLVLVVPKVFLIGSRFEVLLGRRPEVAAAWRFLMGFPLIGAAVVRRQRPPWYSNPDVQFPGCVTAVLLVGWLLL
jgi:hypothetical protein